MLAACAAQAPVAGRSDVPHGKVIGLVDRTAADLHAVQIDRVDGRQLGGAHRQVVRLEPGLHTLGLTGAVVEEGFNTALSRPARPEASNELELEIEAGKVYYVALDTSANRRRDWRPVVWKVEPDDGGLDR